VRAKHALFLTDLTRLRNPPDFDQISTDMHFKTLPLRAIAEHLGDVTLDGDPDTEIRGVAGLREAGPGQLSFLANPRYAKELAATRAAAVIAPLEAERPRAGSALLRTGQPYLAFARALTFLVEPRRSEAGVHPGAVVHPTARLGEGVAVLPGAYVGAGAHVGAGTVLFPGAVVLEDCRIGAGCLLYPGAVLHAECVLGDRVILHANSTVGADGYGFAQDGARHVKIPQVGNVVIEDDVEVGACTCIDRAALGSTVIGRGTKIDDLVMVGHGSKVGADGLIVAQSGLAGSAVLEERVTLGARAGVLGHLTVGAGSVVFSRAHVTKPVPPGSYVSGNPARPHAEELRQEALLRRLERLMQRVQELEEQLAELRQHRS
jgi:UDP-3-O-[3-hydroxymyristoyl] glucosamine N-acyltransferase